MNQRALELVTPPAPGAVAPMRIGFLAQENLAVPPPVPGSSVSRVVHELARSLAERHDVTVCSLPHPTIGEGTTDGIRFVRTPAGQGRRVQDAYRQVLRLARKLNAPHRELQGMPFYGAAYARSGLRRLAEHDPSVVHLQNVSHYLPLARQASPEAHLVLHMHCDWLLQLPAQQVRSRLQHASLVLGVSRYIRDGIQNRFPELAGRCRTLYNGVDCELFRPANELPDELRSRREELRSRLGSGGPVVLYVGTMAPEKGTEVLLRAFALLLRTAPEARLVIVGRHNRYFQVTAPRGWAQRRDLERRQKTYPSTIGELAAALGDRVVFAGGVEHAELPAWYAAADVFVMPSTGNEPFPLPVLEAIASGLPVVATRRGGLPEIVCDDVNGRLVDAGNPEQLADALEGLLVGPETAKRYGAAARERALRRFTWTTQATCLERYYEELR